MSRWLGGLVATSDVVIQRKLYKITEIESGINHCIITKNITTKTCIVQDNGIHREKKDKQVETKHHNYVAEKITDPL